ncbi:5838_t:CDS:2 [Ambispora leptoticha]|uniref:Ubiquitin-conjugating enzyme E2 6 n=1 Tax=Ambispora leptoticha TaxID=144679 RepID=A0A9N9FFT4_9GLOM|nr:5838_t:CDS:2 [Ambispora leptoticha]
MATKAAYKRLTKEYIAFQKNPPPYLTAKPLDSNILEWHYVIRGPQDTPYHNGEYHGVLTFPSEYPYKPPAIRMTTPSGRFQPDARLCLSMSDFHPSTWNPGWSVSTILNGLLSFMCSNEATTGSIKTTDADKKIYAGRSHQYNLNNPKFKEVFPELCIPEAVPVEVLYPLNQPTSNNSPISNTTIKSSKVNSRSDALKPNQSNASPTIQRRDTAQQLQPRVNSLGSIGGENPSVPAQRIFDQWRKWSIFLLLCLYLVVTKLLARSSEAVSGSAAGGQGGI